MQIEYKLYGWKFYLILVFNFLLGIYLILAPRNNIKALYL